MSTEPNVSEDYALVEPTEKWLAFVKAMELPSKHDGESDVDWTDRIIRSGAALGRNRQCSIGYHDECSTRPGNFGECECPCHDYDKGQLVAAVRELEAEVAHLKAHSAEVQA